MCIIEKLREKVSRCGNFEKNSRGLLGAFMVGAICYAVGGFSNDNNL